jgi:hypothetical protein
MGNMKHVPPPPYAGRLREGFVYVIINPLLLTGSYFLPPTVPSQSRNDVRLDGSDLDPSTRVAC